MAWELDTAVVDRRSPLRHDSESWWKSAVIYHVYPRSFCDANGDGIGDLRGITSRLDHLAWLEIDAVWLSPFYTSPMVDFGYDISNYTDVDPLFGTLEQFDELVAEAHRRGIRVLIDWVPNHTSDQHPWFLESRRDRASRKRDWYVWRDAAPDGGPPNDWMSVFARSGPAWTWDAHTGQYYLHSFSAQQPDLNWENPEVVAAMHDTLRFWLDRGVDGFRIDAIPQLGKDHVPKSGRSLEPGARGRWPSIHDHLRGIRKVVDDYGGRLIVGEVTIYNQVDLVAFINSGDGLHLAHNFLFLHQPWDPNRFRRVVDEFESLVTPQAWPCWLLNNHDNSRVASRYGIDGPGLVRARVAALMLLTLRGTPFLYQGEELGLKDVAVPKELVIDINGRDPQRTPIPWAPPSEAGPGAGFTTNAHPWLPITDEAEEVNVATQAQNETSTLCLYREILRLRKRHLALQLGSFEAVATHESVFGYIRRYGDESLLILLNFGQLPVRPLADNNVDGISKSPDRCSLLLSTAAKRTQGRVDLATLRLEREEGLLLRLP